MSQARSAVVPALALAGVGAVALLGYASLVERRAYALRTAQIAILPPGARPIVLLHLSDLHLSPRQRDKIDWVRSLAMLEPDLVIDTGDNVGRVDALPALREALLPLLRRPGVYVDGSNDRFAPIFKNPLGYLNRHTPVRVPKTRRRVDIDAMHRMFDEFGWLNLNNAAGLIEVNGTRLGFVGTDDAHIGADDPDAIPTNLAHLGAADPAPHPIIGVTHAPYRRVLDALTAGGVDAIFAGHTHGGQVCVPFIGALTSNCDLPLDQVKGLSDWHFGERAVPLHVSAGLGTSIYAPVRFACRPEATLVTLVPAV